MSRACSAGIVIPSGTATVEFRPPLAAAAINQQRKSIRRETGERVAGYWFHRCMVARRPINGHA